MSSVIPLHRSTFSADAAPAPGTPVHDTVEALAQQLQATAIARDQVGGHAARERELIRTSGLLTLTIPTEHGGRGDDWSTMYASLRRLAEADSALAHLFGFHHLQLPRHWPGCLP